MGLLKRASRELIKITTRAPLPGSYVLVEALRPLIIEDQPVITRAYGARLELDLTDLVQRQIFFELYDREDIPMLRSLLTEGDVVFDVGGNVGLYSVALAQQVAPSGCVHVFEPIPANIQIIRRNVALNGLEDNVVINPVAAAERSTELGLYVNERSGNSGWASVVPSQRRPTRITVTAIDLDTYVRVNHIPRISLIKMDIEGYEYQALRGMTGILRSDVAPVLYLEVNPFLLGKQGLDPVQVKRYLADFGYNLYSLAKGRLTAVDPDRPEAGLRNILAAKRSISLDGRKHLVIHSTGGSKDARRMREHGG